MTKNTKLRPAAFTSNVRLEEHQYAVIHVETMTLVMVDPVWK